MALTVSYPTATNMKTALDYPKTECRRLWRRLYTYLRNERDAIRRASLKRDMRWLAAGCTAASDGARDKSRVKQFGSANGSASLPWIAEPPRASGLWWWWNGDARCKADAVEVRHDPWMDVFRVGWTMKWIGLTRTRTVDEVGGWWAGPVKPPELPDAETTPNRVLNEPK
jgi:hypothetical protein